MQKHSIEPVFDRDSEILILGSFPSEASRKSGFFYGHPQNRFWRVLASVYGENTPKTNAEKRDFLLSNRIALWDVAGSCDINNSSDSAIKNVTPNDITPILERAKISAIFLNGRTAQRLYLRFIAPYISIDHIYLPSTSPANAKYSLDRLVCEWSVIRRGR